MAESVPIWMKRFIRQDLDEEKEPLVKLLEPNSRNFIWWLCKQYKFTSNGIMGQVCSLLERYMAKKSLTLYYTAPRMLGKRRRVNYDLSTRMPLLASVCVSLTTKMLSSEAQLDASTVKSVLSRLYVTVTLAMINEVEMDVLATLGFRIPLFTNVEKALMMAVDVGMTSRSFLKGITFVTEVAEFYRSDIQQEVINVAFSMRTAEDEPIWGHTITNIRHIHLVAGAVTATGLYLMYDGPDPVPRLCLLTQTTSMYIKCIGTIIRKRLNTTYVPKILGAEPSDGEPSTSRRKRSED